ncbi:MAG: hypothetical protein ACI4IF_01610 [Acutalibacteraceae bacterium]
MAKEKKEFNLKLYAIVVFVAVAVFLSTVTVTAFRSRYNGFSAEKTAQAYVQSIVDSGDGYNAYKNTLISKDDKYGDFIRKNYMYPLNNHENTVSADSTPLDSDKMKGEKTLNDDGTLQGEVIDTMYGYYVELVKNVGWDNYDEFFTKYFNKLIEVRKDVFGDDYLSDEVMFTALESNVRTFGESLTGTEEIIDENTGNKISEKAIGLYEEKYGEDYKFTYETEYSENGGNKTVAVKVLVNGEEVDTVKVAVQKIGYTWYVDSDLTSTEELTNNLYF